MGRKVAAKRSPIERGRNPAGSSIEKGGRAYGKQVGEVGARFA